MSATTALFSAAGVTMSDGFKSSHTISTMRRPASEAIRPCSASTAGMVLALGSDSPSTSMRVAIVDAVPMVLQVPVERTLASAICVHSRWLILPARKSASAAQVLEPVPSVCWRQRPLSIAPAGTKIAGTLAEAAPITSPGPFEKRWGRFARPVGRSWRVDETYVKICGEWTYLYRAVDRSGRSVDFLLSKNRDVAAAKAFLLRAEATQGQAPRTVTLDGYAASHRAVREMSRDRPRWKRTKLRSSKYLNNLIEQDHRGVKARTGPMLGFKDFDTAAIAIAGIELQHRIRKDQFALGRLRGKGRTAPEIWNAVLNA